MKKNSAASVSGTTVAVFQGGVEKADGVVQKGVEFGLVGSGFQPGVTAKICLTGQPCEKTATDEAGGFRWPHTLYYVGNYTVHVYQGTSPDDPPLQFEGTLMVVD